MTGPSLTIMFGGSHHALGPEGRAILMKHRAITLDTHA